jgi:hypothetical protein
MRKVWRPVRCGLTSAACWMLILSADAHAQRADAIGEHLGGPSLLSSAAPIGDTTAARDRLNINMAKWSTSAVAIGAMQKAPAPTRRDSVLDGVLIGAGVGALAGLIPDHYDDCEECHDSLYASIGVGAGVGLLIDALRVKSTASSQSGPQTSLLLSAGSRSTRVRVAGIVRWR